MVAILPGPVISRTRLVWRRSRLTRKRKIEMAHIISKDFSCYDAGDALVIHESPFSAKSGQLFLKHREFRTITS